MQVRLAYGKTGLDINLPDNGYVTVVEPKFIPELPDPQRAVIDALRSPMGAAPLCDQVKATDRVGIVFSDITRASPHQLLIPAVLQELAHVLPNNIILFNALGTHRPNTEAELRVMLGDKLCDGYAKPSGERGHYHIVQNNAYDLSTHVHLGLTSRGHPIWLNRELMACDVIILTGFIEPHFFAGFSGGGKALMPGMAGQPSVLGNHDTAMIADPHAAWGVTWGNPIWEEINEVALRCATQPGKKRIFLLNVTLNRDRQVTGVFAGDRDTAHAAGCAFTGVTAMIAVSHPYDIVITSNAGYPLDLNLYQSVKGMSAAAQIVKTGGAIILAADCWDGIPEHGQYRKLLGEARNPQDLLARICTPGFLEQDQWQAQIQAQIQLKADVYVYSRNLSEAQIRAALLLPCPHIEETVESLRGCFGPNASICVLPEGPLTIPYIGSEKFLNLG
jgi:nickel-dependent lactate racemase